VIGSSCDVNSMRDGRRDIFSSENGSVHKEYSAR
jgi:hypothetical protein